MSIDRRSFMQGSLALVALQHTPAVLSEEESAAVAEELWYKQPAKRWLEALPLGNGRLGGMIFGGIQNETIALSDSTAWSGAPATGEVNPEALPHLREIRDLFFAGKYDEAQALCSKYLPGRMKNFGTNLPLPIYNSHSSTLISRWSIGDRSASMRLLLLFASNVAAFNSCAKSSQRMLMV